MLLYIFEVLSNDKIGTNRSERTDKLPSRQVSFCHFKWTLSREEYKKYFSVLRTIHFISRIDDLWLYSINQGSYCWERIVWEEADAYFSSSPLSPAC